MTLTLNLDKKTMKFFKSRAVYKGKEMKEEVEAFLKQERKARERSDFETAIFD
jgi:formate-dependent nitrite reductase cytochrome c552 subunit